MDIYKTCPELRSANFRLRQVTMEDWADLLSVYSDTSAVPIFNSDNCTGDFYITREEDIRRMIEFWLMEYGMRYYIRWSILDLPTGKVIGTIELFHRTAEDFYNHVGLLRLDLRSDYEREDTITEILSALLPKAYEWFDCEVIATKIVPCAKVRRQTMEALGFRACPELLYGHDGRGYGDYFVVEKQ